MRNKDSWRTAESAEGWGEARQAPPTYKDAPLRRNFPARALSPNESGVFAAAETQSVGQLKIASLLSL